MPVYRLPEEIVFPPVSEAEPDGLLAVGGDLSPERLVTAYQRGIFPWFNDDAEILWWYTHPRAVLFPENIKISKSMRQVLRRCDWTVTADRAFEDVLFACKHIDRKNQEGTWITPGMASAYIKLHNLGIAHSIEIWHQEELIGGLYGLAIGQVFYGESMFSHHSNASKAALIFLCRFLYSLDFKLIDVQQDTAHLRSMGSEVISASRFNELLRKHATLPLQQCSWLVDTKVNTIYSK